MDDRPPLSALLGLRGIAIDHVGFAARAAVYHRDIVAPADVAEGHRDDLKDGGDEWAAVNCMIEGAYGLAERVDPTGLVENYDHLPVPAAQVHIAPAGNV